VWLGRLGIFHEGGRRIAKSEEWAGRSAKLESRKFGYERVRFDASELAACFRQSERDGTSAAEWIHDSSAGRGCGGSESESKSIAGEACWIAKPAVERALSARAIDRAYSSLGFHRGDNTATAVEAPSN